MALAVASVAEVEKHLNSISVQRNEEATETL